MLWLSESAIGINDNEGNDHPNARVQIKVYAFSKVCLKRVLDNYYGKTLGYLLKIDKNFIKCYYISYNWRFICLVS